jgi:hypothetical protein
MTPPFPLELSDPLSVGMSMQGEEGFFLRLNRGTLPDPTIPSAFTLGDAQYSLYRERHNGAKKRTLLLRRKRKL